MASRSNYPSDLGSAAEFQSSGTIAAQTQIVRPSNRVLRIASRFQQGVGRPYLSPLLSVKLMPDIILQTSIAPSGGRVAEVLPKDGGGNLNCPSGHRHTRDRCSLFIILSTGFTFCLYFRVQAPSDVSPQMLRHANAFARRSRPIPFVTGSGLQPHSDVGGSRVGRILQGVYRVDNTVGFDKCFFLVHITPSNDTGHLGTRKFFLTVQVNNSQRAHFDSPIKSSVAARAGTVSGFRSISIIHVLCQARLQHAKQI